MHVKTLGRSIRGFFRLHKGRVRHKEFKKRITDGAAIDGIHVCQLIAAMIIASIGLNVDSTEAVIGAMLICPLMGSVLAIAYGISSLDMKLLKSSILGLVVQVVVCLATSTIYFVVSPLSNTTSELLTNSSATVWDVLIAFVGGFAGALGVSRKQEPATLIAGVAVATALMPPLCSTGYGIASRDLVVAASAFYEFLINVVFIAFGSEIVFVILRVPLLRDLDGDGVVTVEEEAEANRRSHRLRRRLVICSLIFALPCLFFSHRLVLQTMEQNGTVFEVADKFGTEYTTRELKAICNEFDSYYIGELDSYNLDEEKFEENIVATVILSKDIDDTRKEQIRQLVKLNVDNVNEVVFEVSKK